MPEPIIVMPEPIIVRPKNQRDGAYAAWREWLKANAKGDVSFVMQGEALDGLPPFSVEFERFTPNFSRIINGRRTPKRWHKSPFYSVHLGYDGTLEGFAAIELHFADKDDALRFKLTF